MPSPTEVVRSFIAAWADVDVDRLGGFFAEDAVYHNIPVEPVTGRQQIMATIAGFTAGVDRVEFETLHLVADGPVVMTERVDRFFRPDRTIALPVMGIFEVHDGLITAWRDYFDLNQFMSQLA